MKQLRTMSLVEELANVVAGYGIAVMTQVLVFPLFGLSVTLAENMMIGVIFIVVSITRSSTFAAVVRTDQGCQSLRRPCRT